MDNDWELTLFALPEGSVVFRIPKELSPESTAEVEAIMLLVLRRLNRRAVAVEAKREIMREVKEEEEAERTQRDEQREMEERRIYVEYEQREREEQLMREEYEQQFEE